VLEVLGGEAVEGSVGAISGAGVEVVVEWDEGDDDALLLRFALVTPGLVLEDERARPGAAATVAVPHAALRLPLPPVGLALPPARRRGRRGGSA